MIKQWFAQHTPDKPAIPDIIPTETELRRWATSEWIEYQAWLFHHGFVSLSDWHAMRAEAMRWEYRPLISLITPVYNTPVEYLRECVYSLQTQAYPHWEHCLVDDGSTDTDTQDCLRELTAEDPRLKVYFSPENQGICEASNQAIRMATGEYAAFLDHDDRLSPDALFQMVTLFKMHPDTDIAYSDRDMLSPDGHRFMHLFKPGWSPETLLSGNYLFHLLIYRLTLLEKLGGVRPEMEGSQDYDLILRAADTGATVRHVDKVLYHWRQHSESVAMEHNAKEYAYRSGVRALQETLERRGVQGSVEENPALWRGHYRIFFEHIDAYQIFQPVTEENYAVQINQAMRANAENLVILASGLEYSEDVLHELVSWLQVTGVGMVTGKVVDANNQLLHAGIVMQEEGLPMLTYAGHPEDTPGYMAVTSIVRNVSVPHPFCCVLRHDLWEQLGGLDEAYVSPYALLDFALRAHKQGVRSVYNPFARFSSPELPSSEHWSIEDRERLVSIHSEILDAGDAYYSPSLTSNLNDMGLNIDWLA
ncbi:MAG: glycosyltransferase [Pseudomonadota bacterium]